MAVVTPAIVQHVALLARLRLEGDELKTIAAQLDEILDYVQQLREVPTQGVEPTSHVLPIANVLRQDEPQPSLPQETVVSLAPAAHPAFVQGAQVLER